MRCNLFFKILLDIREIRFLRENNMPNFIAIFIAYKSKPVKETIFG